MSAPLLPRVTVIYNAHIVDAEQDSFGAVIIKNGKIAAVVTGASTADSALASNPAALTLNEFAAAELIDAHGNYLLPSFVDMHVHFRYPGQTAKEDLDSGTRAAVRGGYGCVVLMPNTTPVVSDVPTALSIDAEIAAKNCITAFQTVSITRGFGGTDTSHLDGLAGHQKEIPVITEDGHDVLDTAVMREAMQKCAPLGVIVSCHCEDPALVPAAKKLRDARDFAGAERVLAEAEDTFTKRNLDLALETGCRVHIAHCSTRKSLDAVRAAKRQAACATEVQATVAQAQGGAEQDGLPADGTQTENGQPADGAAQDSATPQATVKEPREHQTLPITCEVTPHHLGLSYETPGCGCELVNPPLRSEDDRAACAEALLDGTADVISTDHAPHTAHDKETGACGFSGIETAFAVCYTTLVAGGRMSLSALSRCMSLTPAKLLGLGGSVGLVSPGYDANLVLASPEQFTVNAADFASKGKYSPFDGKPLSGQVLRTIYHGRTVYAR